MTGLALPALLVSLTSALVLADTPGRMTVAGSAELGYAPESVGVCIECHDETEEHPVFSIFKTPHSTVGDPRSPFGSGLGCQACHGASAEHIQDADVRPAIVFGPDTPAEVQNQSCLGCHSGGARMNWSGSIHESRELACVSCHDIHTDADPVLQEDIRPGSFARQNAQAGVCFNCHPEQRAEINRLSAHPIQAGKLDCSDCHNPHGSAGPHNLKELTVNETCYGCHAEKRGPFLWEHGPVREDCTTCHSPHGSTNASLLKSRAPFLCQECHLAPRHVSTQYTGSGTVAGGDPESKLLAGSCLNCHTEIHGSNHPSGVRWTR